MELNYFQLLHKVFKLSDSLPHAIIKKWFKNIRDNPRGPHGKIFSKNMSVLIDGRPLSSLVTGRYLLMIWINYSPLLLTGKIYTLLKLSEMLVQPHIIQIRSNVWYKVSNLPPDAVPYAYDVKDLEKGWRILDHKPLNVPPIKQNFHYDLTLNIKTQP